MVNYISSQGHCRLPLKDIQHSGNQNKQQKSTIEDVMKIKRNSCCCQKHSEFRILSTSGVTHKVWSSLRSPWVWFYINKSFCRGVRENLTETSATLITPQWGQQTLMKGRYPRLDQWAKDPPICPHIYIHFEDLWSCHCPWICVYVCKHAGTVGMCIQIQTGTHINTDQVNSSCIQDNQNMYIKKHLKKQIW